MSHRRDWSGRYAQRLTKLCLATYGDTCHLCGHHGADSADHLTPRVGGGSDDLTNLRPAHYRRCPVCGMRCNTSRGARPLPVTRPPYVDTLDYID